MRRIWVGRAGRERLCGKGQHEQRPRAEKTGGTGARQALWVE